MAQLPFTTQPNRILAKQRREPTGLEYPQRLCRSNCLQMNIVSNHPDETPKAACTANAAQPFCSTNTTCASKGQQADCQPFILGLTGSIGMGKSTASGFFRKYGVPVLEADQVVHDLYAKGGAAVEPVGNLFPLSVVDGAINRASLSKFVVGNEAAMKQLEAVVHPLVAAQRLQFLKQAAAMGHPLVVLDVPLLFETGAEADMDAVVVVTAPPDVQRERVLARPGMTHQKFAAILARQVPDHEKCARADFVVNTAVPLEVFEEEVVKLMQKLTLQPRQAYSKLVHSHQE